ncbi:MAG: DUF6010 family protein [Caldilineaceae bacterium]
MIYLFWLLLGLVLAMPFLLWARSRGPQREPAFWALGLIGAAIIYIGFAIAWGNSGWVAVEIGGLLVYSLFVWLARRRGMVWLAVGWAAHPLWDVVLHWLGAGHMVAPEWYVFACLSFDMLVAGYILVRINQWQDRTLRLKFRGI